MQLAPDSAAAAAGTADGAAEKAVAATDERRIVGGRYELGRLLGRGGMGEVYAAKNLGTGRDVAIKLLRPNVATPEQARRFLREAKAATAIQHPNVIEMLDVFEDPEVGPVMVMELLRGESLAARLRRPPRLELAEVASIMAPVVSALSAAHAKGIVHRDLKPDNIFLSEASSGMRVPKVLDFGIAKVLDPTALSSETQGAGTQTGSLLGTPHYMSFEQAMSEKDIDARSDVWSLGVILFEMLTGRRPLEFDNLGGMYTAFLQGTVPSIRSLLPELEPGLAAVVDHSLAKERAGRLDDLGELLAALEPYVEAGLTGPLPRLSVPMRVAAPSLRAATTAAEAQMSGAVVRSAAPEPRRRRAWPWVLTAGGCLVVAVGAWLAVGAGSAGPAAPVVSEGREAASSSGSAGATDATRAATITAVAASATSSTSPLPSAAVGPLDSAAPGPSSSPSPSVPGSLLATGRSSGPAPPVRPSASTVVAPTASTASPSTSHGGLVEKLPY